MANEDHRENHHPSHRPDYLSFGCPAQHDGKIAETNLHGYRSGAMADIFLSYASHDRKGVRALVEALEREGWSVFWDRDIPLGTTWRKILDEELSAARCIVVAWTKTSVGRRWVIEEAEEVHAPLNVSLKPGKYTISVGQGSPTKRREVKLKPGEQKTERFDLSR
jgi:hypothetical protein